MLAGLPLHDVILPNTLVRSIGMNMRGLQLFGLWLVAVRHIDSTSDAAIL
jgi:hypothetical protein